MLVQLVLTSPDVTTFAVPIYGVCDVQVLSAQCHFVDANTRSRLVSFQSDQLFFQASPARYLQLITNPNGSMTFDSTNIGVHMKDVRLDGRITMQPITIGTSGSGAEGAFGSAVITLNIEKKSDL